MPYRRLPNTDSARIRALKTAQLRVNETPPHRLAFSPKIIQRLKKILHAFETSLREQKLSFPPQAMKVKDYDDIVRKARIYLSHFIRVMNMAVYRGDMPAETRSFYGLTSTDCSVPPLSSENELLSWGRRIIEGEAYRIRKGGAPITNPTAAVVKVWYEKFSEALAENRALEEKAAVYAAKNQEFRKEADEIILDIWNDVENHFAGLPDDLRREKCSEYGVIYYHRKSELKIQESAR